jgi:hypothetical protein
MMPDNYHPSLLSFANQHITNPIQYATFLVTGQCLLDKRKEAESKERIQGRCTQVKEELMMRTWHPHRMEILLNLGYDIEDM